LSWLLFFRGFRDWLLIIGKTEAGNEKELAAVMIAPSQADGFEEVNDGNEWNLSFEDFSREGESLFERYHKLSTNNSNNYYQPIGFYLLESYC
jgi:hypothetical protein